MLMRDWDVLRKKVDVAVSFGGVAGCARAAPLEDVKGKVRPNIPGGNKAAGNLATWVGQVVKMLENEMAERLCDQQPEDSSGDVTKELVAGNRVRGDGEGGGV